MKKLLFLLSLFFLISCEEKQLRIYKVELITGEVYTVKATGYNWWRNGRLEFNKKAGTFYNVKYVMQVPEYAK